MSQFKQIPLTQGKYAIVDTEDYEFISQWKWHHSSGYAIRSEYLGCFNGQGKSKTIYLHRVILGTPEKFHTDHINGDKLDNRRSNLRMCTRTENMRNRKKQDGSSKYKGVTWYKKLGKWSVRITHEEKRKFLGYFYSEESAALAYNKAAKEFYGEFARINEFF